MLQRFSIVIVLVLLADWCRGKDEYLKKMFDDVQVCKLADPDFPKCSSITVQQIFGKLASGIEHFPGVPNIDPLHIKHIALLQGTGPVSINATLNDVTLRGFSKVKVLESHVSRKDFSWITIFDIPKVRLDAKYDLKGKILIIPLIGHGTLWLEPVNMHMILRTKTNLYEKFGHTFYNVTSTKIDFDLTGLKLRLNNLFDGLKSLEESTNKFMNDNWRLAADSLKPIISKTIEGFMLEVLQKVFHYVPADYIVTDIPNVREAYGSD